MENIVKQDIETHYWNGHNYLSNMDWNNKNKLERGK